MVADDLDGVLVAAYGTVGAESVELAADSARGSRVDLFLDLERGAGHVVHDTYGEVGLGSLCLHVLENSVDHRGVEFFGTEAVSAANDVSLAVLLSESRDDVEVERFARAAAFLDSVENGDVLDGSGDSVDKLVDSERTVKSDFEKTGLSALSVEVIYGFFYGLSAAAHQNDDVGSVFGAVVVVQMIFSAGDLLDFFHRFFDDTGYRVVVFVGSLSSLEVYVGVLSGALLSRMLGVEGARLEIFDIGHVFIEYERLELVVIDHFDLGNLVRSSETVEEMQERHSGFQRSEMSDEREVHNFLNGVGAQHRKSSLTARHNVAVVAENVQSVISESACADVENAGGKFTRYLIHIGDHQKKTLACGKGGGQSTCAQRTVYRACCARFGFHFSQLQGLTEQVLAIGICPFVGVFRHRRRRRDRIDRRNFAERISDMRRRGVAVNSHFFAHCKPPIN